MNQHADQTGRYLWALGASVVIHAALLVLSLTILASSRRVLERLRPAESITFTLTPAPETQAVNLQLEPPRGLPRATASRPAPAAPPASPQRGQPDAVAEPDTAGLAPSETRPATVEAEPEALPFEETSEPRPDGRPARPRELRQALRDLGQVLAERRPAAGGPPARRGSLHVITPELVPLPGTGFGVGNLEFESRDYDWSDYGRQIYIAIWQAWHRRLWATSSEFEKWAHENQHYWLDHQTRVRFVIEKSGQVTGIVLERPAGCVPLDESALDALAEVILPPLPEGFPREREVVHASFVAVGEIAGMRTTLSRYKAQGQF